MRTLPQGMATILKPFTSLFTVPTWKHMLVLLTGAILCQGARRVSSILRIMGLSKERVTGIKIDMNNPVFQKDFFDLEKNEQLALIKTLKKIRQLKWAQLYSDNGLNWEAILSKYAKSGARIYSFRFSQKYRATALREDNFLRLLTLHADLLYT